MPAWEILITENLEAAGVAILSQAAHVTDCSGISTEELLRIIPKFHAIIVRSQTRVTSELLERASQLRVIGRAGVGLDNIDLQTAHLLGITVVNTASATSQSVAELTIGLLFALARQIPYLDSSIKQGLWLKKETVGLELKGKTIGIIGLGNIGSTVARITYALGMQVIGHDPYLTASEIRLHGALPATLPELCSLSDFVSLHVPLRAETEGLINRQTLASMKFGVRLVCTSRGGIIDEAALLDALESGQVAGAALDVFSNEPPGSTELVRHPHLVATPHVGAQTHEAQKHAAEKVAQLVLNALNSELSQDRLAREYEST